MAHVQEGWINAWRHPAVMCPLWRKDIKRVEEGKRQRKGGEMGNLSEASVRAEAYRFVVSSYPFPPCSQIFPIQWAKAFCLAPRKAGGERDRNKTRGGEKSRAVGLFKAVMLSIKCHRGIRSVVLDFHLTKQKPPFQYLLLHPFDILFSLQRTPA